MASPSNSEDAGALVGSLLEDKQRELKVAKGSDIGSAALRTGAGAMAGFTSGVAFVFAGFIGLLGRIVTHHPELSKRLEQITQKVKTLDKLGPKELPPGIKKSLEVLVNDFIQVAEKERIGGSLSANIIKHSGGWVAGLTAAGAGLGVLWHMKRHDQKVESIKKEVTKLQHIRDSWQDRVVAKEEKSTEAERAH